MSGISYIDPYLPFLCAGTILVNNIRNASNQTITFAGHFKKTQWRAILESAINITVSLLAVSTWGIYGVLIGTITAMLYRSNDMIIYSSRRILHRSPMVTYKRIFVNLGLFILLEFIIRKIVGLLDMSSYFRMVLAAAGCTIVALPIFFAVVFVFDRKVCRDFLGILKRAMSSVLDKKINSC